MGVGVYFLRQCRVKPSDKGGDGEEGVKVEGRGGMAGVEREAAGENWRNRRAARQG